MEELVKKGTVTSLASLFPVEEAQKAAKRVEDAIADKRSELDRVRDFVADNNNLVNLVHKLPEELSHDIMVPFGKAAFFPGRLIHTNEFLVLLGEGYYAERTLKQTVEILQRRGKSLDSHVDSLEANIKDLEAEASFFNATASQVAEGLVEIREDYVEEDSNEGESESCKLQQDAPNLGNAAPNDGEYARMLAIMDELEKEELAAESGNQSDENDESTGDVDEMSYQGHIDNNLQNSKDFRQRAPLDQTNDKIKRAQLPEKQHRREDITDQLNFASLGVQSAVREREKHVESIYPSEKIPVGSKEKPAQSTMTSKTEVPYQTAQPSFDSRKAFPGSIIEHAENIERSSREQSSASSQISGSQSSKPVSRFKMQRR
ncbi:RNA polymerase II subunit 5-mediating protein homolog isoform X1 [Vigna unguiculata]|uniref:RNA polymerase II subunit 5-mediating protein homolog isoform X1 n=2 Tax=Vigna unguiculata TaxID=3917 RepID=UPI0010170217|nr:RNA polymerase II subunit 5-mediating protein homolog isoform X1 [Vigna unguiculata]